MYMYCCYSMDMLDFVFDTVTFTSTPVERLGTKRLPDVPLLQKESMYRARDNLPP